MVPSYIIYIGTVVLATLFAALAQKYSKINSKNQYILNPIFYWLSMIVLVGTLGFRDKSVGVDGFNYYNNYLIANSLDIVSYYQEYITEPGFYLLYRISYLLGDFQWLFILTAIITLYFFYKALAHESSKINFALAIFIFSTTQYFYYFGIMRMGIAVSIIAFSYQYIIKGNNKKFILFVLLALLFHYSAAFALFVIFFTKNKKDIYKKNNLIKIVLGIPLLFVAIRYLLFPILTIDRYESYVESTGIFSLGFINTLPLLVLFILYYNKFVEYGKYYQFFLFLLIVKVMTEAFAPLIGIGRMVWYLNISICILFPLIIQMQKNKSIKMILISIAVLYCLIYSFNAYFGNSFRGFYMLPYHLFTESKV